MPKIQWISNPTAPTAVRLGNLYLSCNFLFPEGVSRLVQRNPTIKTLRIAGIEERACENGFSSKIQEVYQQKCQEIVDIAATLRGSLVRHNPSLL